MRFPHVLAISPILLLLGGAIDPSASVWGIARAQDGDSLLVEGTRIRLFGIDAPELDQTCTRAGQPWSCGEAAAAELARLVSGKKVMCTSMGKDRYDRFLGRCSIGAVDINSTMVARGYAVAYRRYSSDYILVEGAARAAKLGLWASNFQAPSDYRQAGSKTGAKVRQRSPARSVQTNRSASSCNIKGNRNRRGQWIYHVPGMPYYEQTRPEEVFCTEAEAQAAGYRRAIVR